MNSALVDREPVSLIVMAHHPRTQRVGPESVAKEVKIFEGDPKRAHEILFQLRKEKERIMSIRGEIGDEWAKPKTICGYPVWVSADFYLRVAV